jgi:hypothetical protein
MQKRPRIIPLLKKKMIKRTTSANTALKLSQRIHCAMLSSGDASVRLPQHRSAIVEGMYLSSRDKLIDHIWCTMKLISNNGHRRYQSSSLSPGLQSAIFSPNS